MDGVKYNARCRPIGVSRLAVYCQLNHITFLDLWKALVLPILGTLYLFSRTIQYLLHSAEDDLEFQQ